MAEGNSYPAVQLDAQGRPSVDSGVFIQFTDSTDQPGSGQPTDRLLAVCATPQNEIAFNVYSDPIAYTLTPPGDLPSTLVGSSISLSEDGTTVTFNEAGRYSVLAQYGADFDGSSAQPDAYNIDVYQSNGTTIPSGNVQALVGAAEGQLDYAIGFVFTFAAGDQLQFYLKGEGQNPGSGKWWNVEGATDDDPTGYTWIDIERLL